MDKELIEALREVIREEIMKKNSVEIDGVGRFETTHRKQHQKKMSDGQVLMMPPRDSVIFTPEKQDK